MNDLLPLKSVFDKTEKELKIKPKGKNGGVRRGAGRPKGKPNQATIEKQIAEEELKQRVMRNLGDLLDSQFTLAKGVSYLLKRVTWKAGKGKASKLKIIKDPLEIERYFNGEYDKKTEYYYITTDKPDNKAIDSLLDRTFGRASNSIDLSNPKGEEFKVRVFLP